MNRKDIFTGILLAVSLLSLLSGYLKVNAYDDEKDIQLNVKPTTNTTEAVIGGCSGSFENIVISEISPENKSVDNVTVRISLLEIDKVSKQYTSYIENVRLRTDNGDILASSILLLKEGYVEIHIESLSCKLQVVISGCYYAKSGYDTYDFPDHVVDIW